MTEAQLFCKYVNLTLMLTDSLYWLGTYQIELDGLHDWSMCSLILQVVRCNVSGVYLIWVSGGYWLTVVNISQHNLNHLPHTTVVDLEKYICINRQRMDLCTSHFQQKTKDLLFLIISWLATEANWFDCTNRRPSDENLTRWIQLHNAIFSNAVHSYYDHH